MKCKNLLILSSIFLCNADLPENLLQDVQKLGSTNASLGRIEIGYKGFFSQNSLLVGGFDMSFNPFLGIGYIHNMEYNGWPLELKCIVYFFDWSNKSLSKDYISKMPFNVSVSTNIWGFNIGTSVSYSFNKKFLISAFIKFDLNDDYDASINYHVYGESDFFSKNSYKKADVERLRKDNETIIDKKVGFAAYCKKYNVPGEVQDNIIECFTEHARQTIKVCNDFLDNTISLKSIKNFQSKSLFLLGKSGAGKTNTFNLFKDFVNKKQLWSISLINLNASTFTPEGYKGDNVNEKISSLFNENIKNSKNYKHNAVSIFRSIILVDEIDNISEKNGGSDADNFYTRVQKAMLDFVEGTQLYKTEVGLIPILGSLKILPGAFESKSGELERKVIKNILCEKECFLTSKLTMSLINYIKINYITEHSDCEKYFSDLIDASKDLDELMTKELDKDPNFLAFKRGDKDKNLRSVDEIYKFLEANKVFSCLKNPEVYEELNKFSQLIKNMKKKLQNIQKTKTKEKFSVDPTKFDDLYVRIFENLESFIYNFEERPNEILEIAVENYKRKNALFCISESGMGGEIIRRAATVFYLEKPSFLRSFKYLENSEYYKLLKKNKKNILYLGCNSDDGEDNCIRALLQSIRGGNANNNSQYSFADLEALSEKGIQSFYYAFNVNGKIIAILKKNGIDIRTNDLDDENDININKIQKLFEEGEFRLNKEIEIKKNNLDSLNKSSLIKSYDQIKEILDENDLEKACKDLKDFVQNYKADFLKTQQFKSFCSSMFNIIRDAGSFDEIERMSKLRKLVESSYAFFEILKIQNIIDSTKSVSTIVNELQDKCKEYQEKADSEQLLIILTSLLSNFENKNKLLNSKKSYKKGFEQTIQERISELAIDNKKKKQDVIDLYYEIFSIVPRK